ncbi:MAG TPA: S41 family peptidase [Ramlibacter sp.]
MSNAKVESHHYFENLRAAVRAASPPLLRLVNAVIAGGRQAAAARLWCASVEEESRMKMKRQLVAGGIAAALASTLGFLIHVVSREGIRDWVTRQMAGRQVVQSWDVRYLAGATSLELGVGLVLLYVMVRPVLPGRSFVIRGALLAALLLIATGRFIRQPLMDAAIGNPPIVVLAQNGATWLVWLVMCVTAVGVYEAAMARETAAVPARLTPAARACLEDLDAIPRFLRLNDAGFQQPVTSSEEERREAALESARDQARCVQDDAQCMAVLQAYLKAWRSGHLFVEQVADAAAPHPPSRLPNELTPSVELLSRNTALLTIRTFSAAAREQLAAMLERNREQLGLRPNWIVDVRGNGGGTDTTYAPLLPWLMADGWVEVSEKVYVTPANLFAEERVCELIAPDDAEGARITAETARRMRSASEGTWVEHVHPNGWQHERPMHIEHPRPQRVAVLMDSRCGSSCEQFLLTVRQSFSVKLVGRSRSGGAVDASNLRPHMLPSRKRRLWYATTLSNRLPALPIDGIGVAPDVFLPGEQDEANQRADVKRTQRWLEGGEW